MGWQQNIQSAAASALPPLPPGKAPIVDAYAGPGSAAAGESAGFTTVDSNSVAWYLTHPAGWDADHEDCGRGCSGKKGVLLLLLLLLLLFLWIDIAPHVFLSWKPNALSSPCGYLVMLTFSVFLWTSG